MVNLAVVAFVAATMYGLTTLPASAEHGGEKNVASRVIQIRRNAMRGQRDLSG
jgi:hypothetical protein